MAESKLSWGILGTGGIAKRFANALKQSKTGNLVAVGSRSQQSADAFGAEHDAPNRHGSYDALLADDQVQAVYISLPNHLHAEWTIKCAEAGKHILCEKPLATNRPEAMAMLEAVRRADVFLMEAFMYRCHPQTAKLAELVRGGEIGEVRLIQSNFSYNMGPNYDNIRLRNDAAGGGIMDVGCYTVSMSRLIAGAVLGEGFADPVDVEAAAHIGETSRVDEWATATLVFPGDVLATVACGTQVGVDSTLRVWGTKGHIEVPNPWFPGKDRGRSITVHKAGEPQPRTIEVDDGGQDLYAIEADAVAAHLADRQAPAPCMRWDDSLGNMKTLDMWREAIGLTFDREQAERMTTTAAGRPLAKRPDAPMTYGRVDGVDKDISRIVMGSMIYSPQVMPLTFAMLDYFFEIGGNAIDLAYVYGGGQSEKAVGAWVNTRGVREHVVLLDKGAHPPHTHPDHVTPQILENLDRLRTDYIDLWALHRDNTDVPVGEWVDALNENVEAGRIRVFGGSNWTTDRLAEANDWAKANGKQGFTFSSPNLSLARWNQPFWAGCVTVSDPESRAWHEKTQMPVFAWSSQASGFFAGRITPEAANTNDWYIRGAVETWYNEQNVRRYERARELAAKKGVTATQIAMAYVLSQPFPTFALIGPRTMEETRTSVQGAAVNLSPDELKWLACEDEA